MSAHRVTSSAKVGGRHGRSLCAPGFTLIELMIAMLLGLIVIAGVVSVFLSNQRVYRTNQALGDVQDSTRIGFEMMARDIRNAGVSDCNNNGRVANVLNNSPFHSGTAWWADWNNAVRGYGGAQTDTAVTTGTGSGQRVAGTDSLTLLGGADTSLSVSSYATPTFILNEKTSDLQNGDVVIVCNQDHSVLFQISSYSSPASGVTFAHSMTGTTPGNCSNGLGFPTICTAGGTPYSFGPNSQVTKLAAADWYIGNNPTSGLSLYRMSLNIVSGEPVPTALEMVRGVTAMSILYHQSPAPAFVAPAAVTNWTAVDAMQVTLTMESTDNLAATDAKPITRTFTSTTAVRNRVK
ncbi:MAG: prepilin-type N-terminal cleavage/methylation domain-containing protein [Herbaspirillum sp.]